MPKLLLVEDNDMNRDMLSRRLIKKGYEVVMAFDAERGIQMAKSDSPDLILMDIGLPGMDGWAAARVLKKDPATSAIPVIALTAHALATDRQKALQSGFDEYETKPVELTNLLTKIGALLGRKTGS